MKACKVVKRRGVLSPEQTDFKARRLKAILRRHRAWLRAQASDALPVDDGLGVVYDFFD